MGVLEDFRAVLLALHPGQFGLGVGEGLGGDHLLSGQFRDAALQFVDAAILFRRGGRFVGPRLHRRRHLRNDPGQEFLVAFRRRLERIPPRGQSSALFRFNYINSPCHRLRVPHRRLVSGGDGVAKHPGSQQLRRLREFLFDRPPLARRFDQVAHHAVGVLLDHGPGLPLPHLLGLRFELVLVGLPHDIDLAPDLVRVRVVGDVRITDRPLAGGFPARLLAQGLHFGLTGHLLARDPLQRVPDRFMVLGDTGGCGRGGFAGGGVENRVRCGIAIVGPRITA